MKSNIHSTLRQVRFWFTNPFSVALRIAVLAWCVQSACLSLSATELSLGNLTVPPGTTARMPLRIIGEPELPVSAFALWITYNPALGSPAVASGTNQPNLITFIDTPEPGRSRITGFVTNAPAIATGEVVVVSWQVPADLPAGVYPVIPSQITPNPELRSVPSNAPIAASGAAGGLLVGSAGPKLTWSVAPGVIEIKWSGVAGSQYSVLASTNVAAPLAEWTSLGVGVATNDSEFIFRDSDVKDLSRRFYRIKTP